MFTKMISAQTLMFLLSILLIYWLHLKRRGVIQLVDNFRATEVDETSYFNDFVQGCKGEVIENGVYSINKYTPDCSIKRPYVKFVKVPVLFTASLGSDLVEIFDDFSLLFV